MSPTATLDFPSSSVLAIDQGGQLISLLGVSDDALAGDAKPAPLDSAAVYSRSVDQLRRPKRLRRSPLSQSVDPPKSFAEVRQSLVCLLDRSHADLLASNGNCGSVRRTLAELFSGLANYKSSCRADAWSSCIDECRRHGLGNTLHEDPFTGRAFRKPRGYAGDAELIDLIYGPEDRLPDPEATPLGLDIYRYTTSAPAAEGVRSRRAFIADLIDETTTNRPGSHILSIASGHLREANLTTALRRRRMGRFVALDADRISLEEVTRAYGPYGVEVVPSSFASLIGNRLEIGEFDLIYSTGLFDYLNQKTGRRLVTTMFDLLNPGGELVVANFLPGIRDVGYMEAFMDWKLIYRSRQEMIDLTMEIDESEIHHVALFAEENRNIIFLRVTKKR